MERREQIALWSFLVPATAGVVTWFLFRLAYRTDSANTLAGLAVLDAVAAASGLVLVSRSKPCRGWAVAGAVASVLAVVGAVIAALAAMLVWALSSLTF